MPTACPVVPPGSGRLNIMMTNENAANKEISGMSRACSADFTRPGRRTRMARRRRPGRRTSRDSGSHPECASCARSRQHSTIVIFVRRGVSGVWSDPVVLRRRHNSSLGRCRPGLGQFRRPQKNRLPGLAYSEVGLPARKSSLKSGGRLFLNNSQAHQILLCPVGLFDHALQCFPLEGAVATVEDDGDSPFVGVVINLMRPAAAIKRKPVPN